MKHFARLLMATTLLFSFAEAKEFIIDNAHSNIGFSVKHMMISNVKGNFNAYTADIDFDAEKKVFNKLSAKIEAASIDTGIAKRDEHLKSSDFFDVGKFKTVDFTMTSMKDDKVYGKITIHGITKDVVLNSTIHGVIKDFQGHQRVGFTLEGKLDRKDFGLVWNKILEGGGLTVDDTIHLAIEVEAIEL
jgi:polyisoprenoid-binding protein YceI